MKLAIIREGEAVRYGDRIYSVDVFVNFLNYLSPHFDKIHYFVPTIEARTPKDVEPFDIDSPIELADNIEVFGTYMFGGVVGYYAKLPKVMSRNIPLFSKGMEGMDAALVFIPNSNWVLVRPIIRKMGIPLVTYAVGNQRNIVLYGPKYRGLKRMLALLVSSIHFHVFRRMARGAALSLYQGKELMVDYPNVPERSLITFTSLVSDEDVVPKPKFFWDGKVRMIFTGRLSHEKRVGDVIDAMQIMVHEYGLDARFTVCGIGPDMEALKALAREKGMSDRVEFTGFLAPGRRLNETLMSHDIFVMPSVSEGIPKAVVEALAKGLAVVATRAGGIPEAVTDGENGLLVPVGSPVDIARAVRRLREESGLVRRVSDGAISYAREHTAQKQAAQIASAIKKTAGGGDS